MIYREFIDYILKNGVMDNKNQSISDIYQKKQLPISFERNEEILKAFENARHFIFTSPVKDKSFEAKNFHAHIPSFKKCSVCSDEYKKISVLDIPFETIWLERFNAPLFSFQERESFYGYKYTVEIMGLLITERHPNSFDIIAYNNQEVKGKITKDAIFFDHQDGLPDLEILKPIFEFIKEALQELKDNKSFRETPGIFKVYPRKEKPRKVRINEIVYVGRKNDDEANHTLGRQVTWTHTWEVMGHWRISPGIGHDRSGNLISNGFTWVRPHTKGIGELIKKTRVC